MLADLWRLSPAAAHLGLSQLPNYSQAGLRYQRAEGGFRRPQSPAQAQRLRFETEGLRKWATWAVQGRFAYAKHWDARQAWANVAEVFQPDLEVALPLPGLMPTNGRLGNPYVWADERAGDWQRDHIAAEVQAAFADSARRFAPGLGLGYDIGQGARQNDPRPFYRYRRLRVAPSGLWRVGGRAWLGLEAHWVSTVEDNEAGQFSTDNFLLYRLRGYGTFERTPISSAERRTSGQAVGGQATYRWQAQGRQLIVVAGGRYRREQVREGVAIQREGGQFEESWVHLRAVGTARRPQGWRHLLLQVERRQGTATDPLFRAINAGFLGWESELKAVEVWQPGRWAYCFGASLRYGQDTLYDEAAASRWNLVRPGGQAEYLARHQGPGRWLPFAGARLGYTHVRDRGTRFGRATELTNAVFRADREWLASPSWQLGAEAGANFKLTRQGTTWLRCQARWQVWVAAGQSAPASRHFADLCLQVLY